MIEAVKERQFAGRSPNCLSHRMTVVSFAVRNSVKTENPRYLGLAWAFPSVAKEVWGRRK